MKIVYALSISFLSIFSSCTNEKNEKIPIAILTPVTHPSLEQAEKGFKETIEAQSPGKYRFVTYNAQGNKTLMRAEIEEIIQKGYSLVFTIGASSSEMAAEVFSRRELKTPIVFTCVNDPVEFQIVSSEETPGGHITGVKELVDFEKELELLLQYKPNTQTLLLVFNPMNPGLIKDAEQIKSILKKRGMALLTAEAFQTNELMAKVSPLMSKADALLVLKDNTVVGGLDVLVKLCNQYHIPLMASDLDSPDRGAAFGYGVHEVEFGIEGAKKALQILNDHTDPGVIPVTAVRQFTFKVNRAAAIHQGVALAQGEELP